MGLNVGEVLVAILPLLILLAVLWGFSRALRPRDHGLSDADRYQRELAARSAAHQAAQAQVALAARARIDPRSQPSSLATYPRQPTAASATSASGSGKVPGPGGTALLPDGRLNPMFVQQLRAMVRSGRDADAVRLFRTATGTDAPSARLYIDRL